MSGERVAGITPITITLKWGVKWGEVIAIHTLFEDDVVATIWIFINDKISILSRMTL